MVLDNLKVLVLMGGCSSERDISLLSGHAVVQALKSLGLNVESLDIQTDDAPTVRRDLLAADPDVVFNAIHGAFGEDGQIQAILEELNIPFTGTNSSASALTMDKIKTQQLLKANNIRVPTFCVINAVEEAFQIFDCIPGPWVVKPPCEGSSVGINIVLKKDMMENALSEAFQYSDQVLVEQYIKGRELTVGILDGQPLPVVEICPKTDFFDFYAKYRDNKTDYIVPAKLDEELNQSLQTTACDVFRLTGCRQFARVDFLLDPWNNFYVLEINTIPGFTEKSLLPKAAYSAGIDFNKLCLKLVENSYVQKEKESGYFPIH